MTRLNMLHATCVTCHRCTGYMLACENVNTGGARLAFSANIFFDPQTVESFHL